MDKATQHMDRAMHTMHAVEDSRMEREFARARRHSLFVRLLRIGLPAAAAVIVGGGVIVTWAARSLPEGASVESASLSGDGIVMEAPRMSGFDKNNRPYSMVAERAIQALGGEGGVDLERIQANVTVSNDSTAAIVADKGHYDQAAQKLRLASNIKVDTSDGMTIALKAADIDLKSGTMQGHGPIEIVSPNQTIRAGGMEVRNGGAGLTFDGRVSMTIKPPALAGRTSQDNSSTEPR
ncbi:hypothetical protein GCM10011390_46320 [Aureimonas endophytica]|uniref:Lipopolysaccharide export system protein LptC n=1 Tax=Aureimonas endophytica TaxID=2027858 RepID=A0A917A0X9_9HYPH|nr:LPS export ABC transporter periplasmic protein LptC [Aureimonas endophytica]GGE21695.1 hypothetical protein GCM10011390_46320 [Aureimonas endophytica]